VVKSREITSPDIYRVELAARLRTKSRAPILRNRQARKMSKLNRWATSEDGNRLEET